MPQSPATAVVGPTPSPARRYVLAVDLGTSGLKIGLVDDGGHVVASAFERTSMLLGPDGAAEQDPEAWWQAVVRLTRAVIARAAVSPEAVVAVGCTGQWAVTVPVDAAGEVLMNAVSWMDRRGGPYNRRIVGGFPSLQGYGVWSLLRYIQKVGVPPTTSGADALGHMLFIKHERPEVYARTAAFLEPTDFLNLRLTGRAVATQSTAFPMMLTDNRQRECLSYDRWALRRSGLDERKLPELVPNDAVIGTLTREVAAELGLSPSTAVVAGAGDNHTSAIGAGALADFEGVMTLGSSGYLACHVPFKRTSLVSMLATMPSPIPGRRLIFADLGNNGKVLDSFLVSHGFAEETRDGAIAPEAYARMSQMAEETPAGSHGLVFLPWYNGTLSPKEDHALRGALVNLSHATTRADLARAVLEGTACNWRWLTSAVERFVGRPFPYLRLAGGGALSTVWAQILADVLDRPVHQLEEPRDVNVLGTAFLAFHRLGMVPLADASHLVRVRRVLEPRRHHRAVYDELFRTVMACQGRLRPVFHRLNRRR